MMTSSENEVVFLAQFIAKPGKDEDLIVEIQKVMAKTLAESGCRQFVLYQSIDNPLCLIVAEKFGCPEDFKEYIQTPYIKTLLEERFPDLVETSTVNFYKEIPLPEALLYSAAKPRTMRDQE